MQSTWYDTNSLYLFPPQAMHPNSAQDHLSFIHLDLNTHRLPSLPSSKPSTIFNTFAQLAIIRRFAPRQRTGSPVYDPLLPFHDHEVALPRRAMRQDGHAPLRVHHVVEVAPVMRGLPLPIRGDGGVGGRGCVLGEVSGGLDSLACSSDEPPSSTSSGCGPGTGSGSGRQRGYV